MMLVGLSGYARAGKDTVAEVLMERGWKRLAFADTLRDCLYALNPIVKDYDYECEHLHYDCWQELRPP